jgi:oxygen-dependent protoporphyrinogen oxidase
VWLNLGAHVFAGGGSATGRLLAELGVPTAGVAGRLAAVALGSRIAARGPVETYPFRLPLSGGSRLALIRAGARLRLAVRSYGRVAAERPGEPWSERQRRLLEFRDDHSFADFVGALPPEVDAIFRATLNRSSGEPEELAAGYGIGYFHLVWNREDGLSRTILGGPSRLVEALAARLGDRVRTGADVTEVAETENGVVVRDAAGGELTARAAIVATPAHATRAIVRGLPAETEAALGAIRYGPYVVGAFLTSETGPTPWDDLYALATPGRSFGMLFNTVNALRHGPRQPRGALMVYAAANAARALADLDDDAVAARFLADLEAIYPELRGLVAEIVIRRWERGLPYAAVGRGALQAALTRPLGRVHLAGDYLGTWYTETACATAEAAARSVSTGLTASP